LVRVSVPEITPASAARSYLYVPADRPDLLARATSRGADALILDLEDAVPVEAKERARKTLANWLTEPPDTACQLWVRVNPDVARDDLAAVITPHVTGIVVPKAEPSLLSQLDQLLAGHEQALGFSQGRFLLLPLIETAHGLLSASSLAAAPRVARLGIGEADLAAELGMQPGPARAELVPLRLQIVIASAAQGIGRPVGPTSLDFRDLASLRDTTAGLLRLGFRARTAIHPAQVATINEVFTPAEAEIARARAIVAAFEAAHCRGSGITVDEEGMVLDLAVVRTARETLARAASSA
jgi:citrate lyase subunit beta / citryl-CoA lyase